MIRKKLLIHIFLVLSLLASTSCVTKFLWGKKKYTENVTQLLIGERGQYIVLIGKEFHYVLTDSTGILATVLGLRQEELLKINIKKTYMKILSQNRIEGRVVINGPFNILPIKDIALLRARGLREDKRGDIEIKIKVKGKRYRARPLGDQFAGLGGVYKIPVYYTSQSNIIKDAGRMAITPIAVSLDAVLLIGKAIVYPVTSKSSR